MNTQIIIISDPNLDIAFQSWDEVDNAFESDENATLSDILDEEFSDYKYLEIDLNELSADDVDWLAINAGSNYPSIEGLTDEQAEHIQNTLNLLDEYNEVYDLSPICEAPDDDGFRIYRTFKNAMDSGNPRIRTGRSEHNDGQLLVSCQSEADHHQTLNKFLADHPGALNINQITGTVNGAFSPLIRELNITHLTQCKMTGVSSPFSNFEIARVLEAEAARAAQQNCAL